jgi:hypothetical protein
MEDVSRRRDRRYGIHESPEGDHEPNSPLKHDAPAHAGRPLEQRLALAEGSPAFFVAAVLVGFSRL